MNDRKLVLGIDPSMTRIGWVLCVWQTHNDGFDYIPFNAKGEVLARGHISPLGKEGGPLWFRVNDAVRRVGEMVREVALLATASGHGPLDAIVMEDPTDQSQIGRGEYRSPASIAVLAALVGALYLPALAWAHDPGLVREVALVPAGEWLPKVRGKRGWHPMKSVQREKFVRAEFIPECFPLGKRGGTDHDVLAAAGVARWWALRRWALHWQSETHVAKTHIVDPTRVAE